MRLICTAFRCFKDKTFLIRNEGVILLSGGNGSGKTTFIEAWNWVLYGNVKKVCPYGTKKAHVTLEYDGYAVGRYPHKLKGGEKPKVIKITRKKGPNLLLVECEGKKHEDKEAQNIIDRIFGTADLFPFSYVKQKERDGLFSGTNAQNMENFEKFTFKGDKISTYKQLITQKTKDENELRLVTETKHTTLTTNLKEFLKSNPTLPEKMEVGKEEKTSADERDKKITELRSRGSALRTQIATRRVKKEQKDKLDKDLKLVLEGKAEADLRTLKEEVEEKLPSLRENLPKAKLLEEYRKVTKPDKKELETLDSEVKVLATTLGFNLLDTKKVTVQIKEGETWIERLTRMSELHEEIGCDDMEGALKQLEEVEGKLAETKEREEKLKKEAEKVVMVCPECDKKVVLHEGKLGKVSVPEGAGPHASSHQEQWKAAKAELSSLNKKVDTIREAVKELKTIREPTYYQTYSFTKTKEILANFKKLLELLKKKNKLTDDSEKLSSLSKVLGTAETELKETYEEIKKKLDEVQSQYSLYDGKLRKVERIKEALTDLGVFVGDEENDEKELQTVETSLQALEKEKLLGSQREREVKLIQYRDELKLKVEAEKKVLESSEKRLKNLLRIRNLSERAETLALETTVSSINLEVAKQLSYLFRDPITARVTTDGKKHCLNLEIGYEGRECKSLAEISTGEGDRVSLAITLALNRVLNSPLLFLDETMSSFDIDITEEVIRALRMHGYKTPVFVVHHGATAGSYDDTLTFTK